MSITIPNGVPTIKSSAFFYCSGLTSITIPNSVTSIDEKAFYGCSGLTSITIPNSVTSIDEKAFYGCSGLTSVIFNCTTIDNWFSGNTSIKDIIIGEEVTSIVDYAFSYCSGLTSIIVEGANSNYDSRNNCNAIIETSTNTLIKGCINTTIPNSVTSIGDYAFSYCSGLTSVSFPNSITTIGNGAFYGCSGLISVTFPNSVTSIGYGSFYGCSGLKKVIVSDVSSWCQISFNKNGGANPLSYAHHLYSDADTEITELVIDSDVERVDENAFVGCTDITKVIIHSNLVTSANYSNTNGNYLSIRFGTGVKEVILGDEIMEIGNHAFYTSLDKIIVGDNLATIARYGLGYTPQNVYTNKGNLSTLALWQIGANVYDVNTDMIIEKPSFSLVNSTQTTIEVSFSGLYEDYNYSLDGQEYHGENVKKTNLRPDASVSIGWLILSKGDSYNYYIISSSSNSFQTKPISPSIEASERTATSAKIEGTYIAGDAVVVSQKIIISKNTTIEGNNKKITGLAPNTTYSMCYEIEVAYGENNQYKYKYDTKYGYYHNTDRTFSTEALTLTTSQPKVVSLGNAIVAATTNVDEEEENVGFEWRRTDWTDDFSSSTGKAYIYEGTMEGYIRNLNTEKLWKYRPYYLADNGTYYYGDWVGLDPTNTSYFEPTVHTYAQIVVEGNTALVKGYALEGSDNVTVQGFKYWKNTGGASRASGADIPSNANTIEASGTVMEVSLSNLDFDSNYSYVAFVTTSSGTYYGEIQTFTTGSDPTGINVISNDKTNDVHEVARYNMQGRRIAVPEKGINIVRMSDGTTRKIFVK